MPAGGRGGDHSPPLRVAGAGLFLIALFFSLAAAFGWLPRGYWQRYSKETFFFDDFVIDTEGKFWLAAGLSFLNTVVNQWVRQHMVTWINNCLSDHKTPRSDLGCTSDATIYAAVHAYYTFTALASTLNIFLALTSVWTLIFQVLATLLVTTFTTRRFLSDKRDDCAVAAAPAAPTVAPPRPRPGTVARPWTAAGVHVSVGARARLNGARVTL